MKEWSALTIFFVALWFAAVTVFTGWTMLTFIPMNLNPCGDGFITQPVAGHGFYCVKATKWRVQP